jgi:hypothetical protein
LIRLQEIKDRKTLGFLIFIVQELLANPFQTDPSFP